jgi:hypothetical protein
MKKIETIWHHLLNTAITEKRFKHTQQELAHHFNYSLSTVHHALAIPTQIGDLRKESKWFNVENYQKLLYYWASVRNLEKDVVYRTFVNESVLQIEGLLPPHAIYAGYSAARKLLTEPPSDYSLVHFYIIESVAATVHERFPPSRQPPNVFVLKQSERMDDYGQITTLPQTFVDIWNLRDWYSKDFTEALEEKLYGLLS